MEMMIPKVLAERHPQDDLILSHKHRDWRRILLRTDFVGRLHPECPDWNEAERQHSLLVPETRVKMRNQSERRAPQRQHWNFTLRRRLSRIVDAGMTSCR